ncbi:MAG: shikimate dehydrogenase [Lachnospiraceae bacterium]|nr:shikimate dehydrogenase [Ruminococcus sp.]MCM1274173.1 shikimate dehydrogenase [Lachnospiraceae bacterium]
MRKFCLIGHPLGHSLSPQIHARLFELSGEKAEYTLEDIAPEELESKYGFLSEFDGFNITIPHKVAIIDYCDELSDGAKRYKSVNCVKNGAKKVGYNTDCTGFTKSIELLGASLGSKVLLIGCGGVGRMMAVETALSGGELTIAALENDLPLAANVIGEIQAMKPTAKVKAVKIPADGLSNAALGDEKFDLLVNACPVGMFPKTDRMPCLPEVLDNVKFVFDAIYNPKETLLAKTAREKGCRAMTGMAMLVLQAAAAHEIWDGAEYKKEDVDKLIADMEALV